MKQEIILKYIEGKATAEETKSVVEWIDAEESHLQEYLALRRIFEIALWSKPVSPVRNKNKIPKGVKEVLKIAAVFGLGLFSFYVFNLFKSSNNYGKLSTRNIIVPEGQRVHVELSDGSKVWVNANSKLSILENEKGETREVFLDGEAHFNIAPDVNRKFVVNTEKYQMTVLGTEFNVKTISSRDYFDVALVHGSLEVSSLVSDESVVMEPNDRLYAVSGSRLQKDVLDKEEYSWIDGILYLNDLSVSEIFEKLEQYYDVDIQVQNSKILNDKFTGKFWINDGIDQVLKVLKLTNDFSYRRIEDKDRIIIRIY